MVWGVEGQRATNVGTKERDAHPSFCGPRDKLLQSGEVDFLILSEGSDDRAVSARDISFRISLLGV